ncbi:hypothetical protein ACFL1X_11250 [Candidatus Hydrogenedentota bacterium]
MPIIDKKLVCTSRTRDALTAFVLALLLPGLAILTSDTRARCCCTDYGGMFTHDCVFRLIALTIMLFGTIRLKRVHSLARWMRAFLFVALSILAFYMCSRLYYDIWRYYPVCTFTEIVLRALSILAVGLLPVIISDFAIHLDNEYLRIQARLIGILYFLVKGLSLCIFEAVIPTHQCRLWNDIPFWFGNGVILGCILVDLAVVLLVVRAIKAIKADPEETCEKQPHL